MTDQIKQILERTRATYDKERTWHRFLIDAYTGGGGFQGRVKQPDYGFWGAAAEVYSNATQPQVWHDLKINTYLDRYWAEDELKFKQRVDISHYPNYVGPLTDLKLSFMMAKEFALKDIPARVEQWRENVDGGGTTFDEALGDPVLRAALTGWCPTLIDMDPAPRNERGERIPLTRAQAMEAGIQPRMIPLFPANLLEWSLDDAGTFQWAKILTVHSEQPTPWEPAVTVKTYRIWYPDRVHTFEARRAEGKQESIQDLGEETHPFGRVPLAVLRHRPDPESGVKGIPMHGQVSVESRRLFNLVSEFDEHIRSQVFAILVWCGDKLPNELRIGAGEALHLGNDARHAHQYIAPPSSVSASFEDRIKAMIKEIHRLGRAMTEDGDGANESGLSRRLKFRNTNRAIADYARQVGRWIEDVHELVGRALGVSDDELRSATVTPPTDFDIIDLEKQIKNTLQMVDLRVGATALTTAKMRIIQEMLPNLDRETRERVETEVENLSRVQEQREAAEAAAFEATVGADPFGEAGSE